MDQIKAGVDDVLVLQDFNHVGSAGINRGVIHPGLTPRPNRLADSKSYSDESPKVSEDVECVKRGIVLI
jgi:hypothetical protein